MEERLPFIAAVVSGVITWFATLLFLDQYLGLMTVILILALLFAKFEPWAFIGSFLIGLALELFSRGATEELRLVLLLLIGGTVLQAVIVFSSWSTNSTSIRSSTGQNIVFALLGLALNRVMQFLTCPPGFTLDFRTNLAETFLAVMNCHMRRNLEILTSASTQQLTDSSYLNALAMICLRSLLISPALWAAFFAALSQLRFNLLQPTRLLRQTFKGLIGISLAGIIAWGIILLAGFFVYFAGSTIESGASQSDLTAVFLILFLSVDAFFSALGAGWAATWGT